MPRQSIPSKRENRLASQFMRNIVVISVSLQMVIACDHFRLQIRLSKP